MSDLWNEWVEPYDLFVSYARVDNDNGMVSALVESIEADFARFSPSVPLKVFFDKKSILDMEYWQDKLKKGLRQSKVMLAVLSEAYFKSEWCRREWEEYILVEQARTYPGEALTPIFIIAPEDLDKKIPATARDWWSNVTARNAVVEIHPYWPNGRSALQERIVVERLGRLNGSIRERVEHGRVLTGVPRDIRGRNPNFVGRKRELVLLRDALARHEMVGICAVNGVGGIGKSSVAREYAYLFRKEYLGGQFEIDLSTIRSIGGVLDELVRIARSYLGADIAPELPEREQHTRAKAAFQRLPAGQTVLLILDNLNEDATELVGQTNRDALPAAEKVHLLVTTRADSSELGGMETVALDCLPPGEALDLLFRYRAFDYRQGDADYQAARAGNYVVTEFADLPPDEEWKAALAIVNRLGRHTLAVTLVAAYLGFDNGVSYVTFYRQLERMGIGLALDKVGSVKAVRNLVKHPDTLIGPLFERSVARLSRVALRTLEYAAFLPADLVPLAWLEKLVTADAEMADEWEETIGSPPWERTLAELEGLQYLIGKGYARIHRVVQEVIRRRLSEDHRDGRKETVLASVAERVLENWNDPQLYADLQEIRAVTQFILIESDKDHPSIGCAALCIVKTLQEVGQLRDAIAMARHANRILNQLVSADSACAEMQLLLSISFDNLGNVSVKAGDLEVARRYYEQGLVIRQRRADAEPASTERQRDLAISFNKLGDVRVKAGDLMAAQDYFEQGLAINRRLEDAGAASAENQRGLAISFDHLGIVSMAAGNLEAARGYFEQELAISRRLADADPASVFQQSALSISFNRLGDVSMRAGDLEAARDYFEQDLTISRRLADADADSAVKKRHLAISFDRLGDVSMAVGDLMAASGYFEQGFAIRRRLADADPASAEMQSDLSVSLGRLGGISSRQRNREAARSYYEQALTIHRRLAEADPASADWQRDLTISYEQLGDVHHEAGDLEAALGFHEQALAIRHRLADADPASADRQRDIGISVNKLGNLSLSSGDPVSARDYYAQFATISRRLANADPASADKQRDLGLSFFKLGMIEDELGNRPDMLAHLATYVAIWGKLEAAGKLPSPDDRAMLHDCRCQLDEWTN